MFHFRFSSSGLVNFCGLSSCTSNGMALCGVLLFNGLGCFVLRWQMFVRSEAYLDCGIPEPFNCTTTTGTDVLHDDGVGVLFGITFCQPHPRLEWLDAFDAVNVSCVCLRYTVGGKKTEGYGYKAA